jgi:hypothetical protein
MRLIEMLKLGSSVDYSITGVQDSRNNVECIE